jgi:putative FmdB family regulatory protein
MPIYEYHCEDCDKDFEALLMRSSETVHCPSCGGGRLHKLISAHAVGHGMPDTACGSAPCSPAPMCGSGACPACE